MADLPSDIALGGLQTASGERQVASVDTSAIGQGVARFGQGVDQLSNGVATFTRTAVAQSNAVDEAKATAAYSTGRINLDDETKSLTDPTEITAQTPKYNANLEAAAALIADPHAREMFKLRYQPDVARGAVGVSDYADTRQKGLDLATFDQSVGQIIDNAPKVSDEVRAKNLDTINTSIDKLLEDDRITPAQAVEWKRAYSQKYLTTSLGAVRDPNDRLNLLREAPVGKEATLNRIGGVEDASGDPTAKNPNSSATGQFQFINSTWLGLVRSYRPDLANKPESELLALRADKGMQREMASHYYDEIAGYFQSRGIEPTAANMRLGWFLGQGDAAKVIKADPSTPIADLVNGQSIAANPTILPGRTAGTVMQWATKQMGGTAPGGSVYTQLLPQDKVVDMRSAAARAAQQADDAAAQQSRTEVATVQQLLKDDQTSIVTSGKPLDGLTPERVGLALGSQAQADFLAERQLAQAFHDKTYDWNTLPKDAIDMRVEALKPAPGSANYEQAQKYYEAAQKASVTIVKAREADPAGTVDTLPAVKAAKQAADPQNPASFVPVVKARMLAQGAIGVAPLAQSPITKSEVDGFTSQLMPLTRGQANVYAQNDLIDKVIGQVKTQYGPYAPRAMTDILANIALSPEASYAVAAAVRKLSPEAAPAQPDVALAPPPSIDPGRWQKILDKRPLDDKGQPMPAGEWATFMHRLAANPTAEEVAMFNASRFGRAGFDGNEILKQLAGQ